MQGMGSCRGRVIGVLSLAALSDTEVIEALDADVRVGVFVFVGPTSFVGCWVVCLLRDGFFFVGRAVYLYGLGFLYLASCSRFAGRTHVPL